MPNPLRINPANSLALLLAVLMTGAGACSSGGSTRVDADDDAPPARAADSVSVVPAGGADPVSDVPAGAADPVSSMHAVPEQFSMIFGDGGGFTGRWNGFAIRADGTVIRWSGPTADESIDTPAGTLEDSQRMDLWARIEAVEFFDLDVQEVGNVTAFMQVTSGGRTHRVSWIPGAEGFEPPRSPLDALYRHSLQIAQLASE